MEIDVRDELVAMAPRLRRFAYSLCGDIDRGDDLVQSACVKALTALDKFQPGSRLDSWMFRIIQNCYFDEMRRRKIRGENTAIEADLEISDSGVGARAPEDRLELARVRAAMAALPEDQRAVLALVAIEGLTYAEAADALGAPIGTVMSRLSRARAKLKQLFEGEAV